MNMSQTKSVMSNTTVWKLADTTEHVLVPAGEPMIPEGRWKGYPVAVVPRYYLRLLVGPKCPAFIPSDVVEACREELRLRDERREEEKAKLWAEYWALSPEERAAIYWASFRSKG